MSKLDKSTIAWKKKRFDEVAVIANGQVDPRIEPYCREIHIGPENIESHTGRIINLQKAEELGLISGKYVFDENSIIYSKIRPNLNKLCQPSFRGICSADMYPIWAKEEIKKSYLYYFMQSPAFYNQAIKSSMRTGIPKINRQDLNRIKITYPVDHAIQNRIVNTISVWDNAIEKTEALIAAKEKQFEWLKSQLLLNNPKSKRWNTSTLGEFIVEKKEKSTTPDLYPCLTSSRRGIFLQEDYFSKQIASKDNSGYKIMSRGDFTFRSMSDDGFFVFNKQTIIDKGLISPAYGVFSPKQNMDSDFLYYFLNSPAFRRALSREVQGGTRTALKLNALKKLEVKIPCIQEQKDIASKLNIAKKEIDLAKELLEKYRSQKRGLMQKLLTGEWQVGSSQHLSEETYQEASA
ncbi:MAG: restriction endonuclease subunit S [Methyloprofundus sp.]|nr:restriction endonuclease subunit S [Methyloprofundus sp.]